MNKIPVWKTVSYAYSFTFGHLGTIIGVVWIPAALTAISGFFLLKPTYAGIVDLFANANAQAAPSILSNLLGYELISFFLLAVAGVAVTSEAIGLKKSGPVIAQFTLGPATFRVFGTYLTLVGIAMLFAIVFYLAAQVIAATASATAGQSSTAVAPLVLAFLQLVAMVLMAYWMVRLAFLAVPATVAEGRVGVIRSWLLTKGNFWRIFLISVLTLVPVGLLLVAVQTAILGTESLITPPEAMKDQATYMHFLAKRMGVILDHLPLLMGLNFLVSPIVYGLIFTSSAIAYRALVPPGAEPAGDTA
ncbi:MAG: hypothetical protein HY243_13020 [Proteobacteria bacterium]|nr:hypothetical protein [Pseudomonadota bacterium]